MAPHLRTKTTKDQDPPDGYEWSPPDARYAWVVAGACFMSSMITVVPLPTLSVILGDVMLMYDINTATVAWLPALMTTTSLFLGPVNAIIVNTYGYRKAAVLGSIILFCGMTSSYFTKSILTLCLTFSVLIGAGSGLIHTCYPVVLSQYFKKYYGIALGIVAGGYAASRLTTTLLVMHLVHEYGCRTVFLLMGAYTLHNLVCVALFQPSWRHAVPVPIRSTISGDDHKTLPASNEEDGDLVAQNTEPQQEVTTTLVVENNTVTTPRHQSINLASSWNVFGSCEVVNGDAIKSRDRQSGGSLMSSICSKVDYGMLKEAIFYVACSHGLLFITILVYSNVFLFPLCREMGRSETEAASVVSIKAIADIVSRIGGPPIIIFAKIPHRLSFVVLNVIHAVLMMVVGFTSRSFSLMMSWVIVSGLVFGVNLSTSGVLILDVMGAKRLASTIGLSAFVQGIFTLPMAYLLGFVRDFTGTFIRVYQFLALLQFLLAILWIIQPHLPKQKQQT